MTIDRATKAAFLARQGAAQIVNPVKAKISARFKRAKKKAVIERNILFRQWKDWRREREQQLLDGPHGKPAKALIDFLAKMTLDDGHRLVAMMEYWRNTDVDAQFQILSLVDLSIIRLREKADMPPFNDALPGQPLTVFQIIRKLFDDDAVHLA